MMKKIIARDKPSETRVIKSNVAKKKALVNKYNFIIHFNQKTNW